MLYAGEGSMACNCNNDALEAQHKVFVNNIKINNIPSNERNGLIQKLVMVSRLSADKTFLLFRTKNA